MPVFTIAGLTLKEAIRRRTLVGALLLGLLVLGLSLMLLLIRARFHSVAITRHAGDPAWFSTQYTFARSIITTLCIFSIRVLGSLFAILIAGGSISGEIERGLLAVILPKPIHRWQILLGKWLGLNIVLVGSVLVWTAMIWASLTLQTRTNQTPLLVAGLYLSLFPVVICTLTLSLSTIAQRLLGTSLALALSAFAWMDGIFNGLGAPISFDVPALRTLAVIAGLVVPQGYIAWWVEDATKDMLVLPNRGPRFGESPQFLKDWGILNLNYPHLDAVYVALYILAMLALGVFLFQKRDV